MANSVPACINLNLKQMSENYLTKYLKSILWEWKSKKRQTHLLKHTLTVYAILSISTRLFKKKKNKQQLACQKKELVVKNWLLRILISKKQDETFFFVLFCLETVVFICVSLFVIFVQCWSLVHTRWSLSQPNTDASLNGVRVAEGKDMSCRGGRGEQTVQ